MNTCPKCNGLGHIALRGDQDTPCPLCGDADVAPVVVKMGGYTATVAQRNGFYHLSLLFLDTPETLVNAFCSDHHAVIAMGKALMYACRPDIPKKKHVGYWWNIGEGTFTGWITFRGHRPDALPHILSKQSGFELGYALTQLGMTMKMQREFAMLLNELMIPMRKAG